MAAVWEYTALGDRASADERENNTEVREIMNIGINKSFSAGLMVPSWQKMGAAVCIALAAIAAYLLHPIPPIETTSTTMTTIAVRNVP